MTHRVTITLPGRVLAKLNEDVRLGRRPNRSAAIAAAVEDYYARAASDSLREATIAYYQGLSEEERADDAGFASASRDALAAVLASAEARPGPAPRPRPGPALPTAPRSWSL